MEKLLVVSLHDVSPKFEKELELIISELNKIKINKKNLLIIPNLNSSFDISKNQNFIKIIKDEQEKGAELTLHGFYHENQEDFLSRFLYFIPVGVNEFGKIDLTKAKKLLGEGANKIKKIFGIKPRGFVPPNWVINKRVQKEVFKQKFDYFTTIKTINYPIKKIYSLAYGFSAGNNVLLSFIIRYFSFLRIKFFKSNLIRFVIHPQEVQMNLIPFEVDLLKNILSSGYKPITYSECTRVTSIKPHTTPILSRRLRGRQGLKQKLKPTDRVEAVRHER